VHNLATKLRSEELMRNACIVMYSSQVRVLLSTVLSQQILQDDAAALDPDSAAADSDADMDDASAAAEPSQPRHNMRMRSEGKSGREQSGDVLMDERNDGVESKDAMDESDDVEDRRERVSGDVMSAEDEAEDGAASRDSDDVEISDDDVREDEQEQDEEDEAAAMSGLDDE
jgi:hypothetical protein